MPSRSRSLLLAAAVAVFAAGAAISKEAEAQSEVGMRWVDVPLPRSRSITDTTWLQDLALADTRTGWAVGARGLMLRYSNGVLRPVASVTGEDLYAVDYVNDEEAWAVGTASTFLRLDRHGWTIAPTELARQAVLDVDLLDSESGWAVGHGGAIWALRGGRWLEQASPTTLNLNAVVARSPTEAWAVGGYGDLFKGLVLRYASNDWHVDSLWTRSTDGIGDEFRDVDVAPDGTVYVVGDAGRLYTRVAGAWSQLSIGQGTLSTLSMRGASASRWLAGSENRQAALYRLVSGTWAVVDTPLRGHIRKVTVVEDELWVLGIDAAARLPQSYVMRYTDEARPFRVHLPALADAAPALSASSEAFDASH